MIKNFRSFLSNEEEDLTSVRWSVDNEEGFFSCRFTINGCFNEEFSIASFCWAENPARFEEHLQELDTLCQALNEYRTTAVEAYDELARKEEE